MGYGPLTRHDDRSSIASQRITRRLAAALAAVATTGAGALALPLPASAEAAMRYEGGTGQGMKIKVRTNDRGVVNRVRVGGRVRCRDGAGSQGYSVFTRPFQRANPKGFRDRDREVLRESGIRVVIVDEVNGEFVNDSKRRLKGTYRVRIDFRSRGRTLDRCNLRTRWRAGVM